MSSIARVGMGVLAALLALLFPRRPVTAVSRRKGTYTLLQGDGLDEATRRAVGAAWRQRAESAHRMHATRLQASIALVKLKAGADLVVQTHQALAEDFTSTCMSIARAIDGAEAEIGSLEAPLLPQGRLLSMRTAMLAVLAAEMLGVALAESIAARVDAKLARRATDAEIRRTLLAIAASERRHARHAWTVVAWCREQDASVVEPVVRVAMKILRARLIERVGARDGFMERWGVAGQRLERTALDHVLGFGASGPSFATSPSAS